LRSFFDDINFELPDFRFDPMDYSDKYYAVTIGRELIEIQYEFLGEPWTPRTMTRSKITLSEDFFPQVLRLYVMERIPIFPPDFSGYNLFYIMDGSNKIFHGSCLFQLNGIFEPYGENFETTDIASFP
jgi:hypothetical protein